MQSLCREYIQMLCHYFIGSLSVHLMWGIGSGERDAVFMCAESVISCVIFFGSANAIVHSSLQKCDFVKKETYSDEMFYTLWQLRGEKKSSFMHLLGW